MNRELKTKLLSIIIDFVYFTDPVQNVVFREYTIEAGKLIPVWEFVGE